MILEYTSSREPAETKFKYIGILAPGRPNNRRSHHKSGLQSLHLSSRRLTFFDSTEMNYVMDLKQFDLKLIVESTEHAQVWWSLATKISVLAHSRKHD